MQVYNITSNYEKYTSKSIFLVIDPEVQANQQLKILENESFINVLYDVKQPDDNITKDELELLEKRFAKFKSTTPIRQPPEVKIVSSDANTTNTVKQVHSQTNLNMASPPQQQYQAQPQYSAQPTYQAPQTIITTKSKVGMCFSMGVLIAGIIIATMLQNLKII